MSDNPDHPYAGFKEALQADLEFVIANKAASIIRAPGEAIYPEPGFKASRLVEPEGVNDFGYLTDADVRRRHRNPIPGSAPDPRAEEARERAAMRALRARRGCPARVVQEYVDVLRRQGAWWNDIPL